MASKCFGTRRLRHAIIGIEQEIRNEMQKEEAVRNQSLLKELSAQLERMKVKLSMLAVHSDITEAERAEAAAESLAVPARVSKEDALLAASLQSDHAPATSGIGMTNEQLAHELLLDPSFQLHADYGCAPGSEMVVRTRIRNVFERAFWDSLLDDLCLKPCPLFSRVLNVLDETQKGLLGISRMMKDASIRQQIEDVMDTDFIKRRIADGAWDYDDGTSLLGSIFQVICLYF